MEQAGVIPYRVEARGALVTYTIRIGLLCMQVTLLNIPEKASNRNRHLIHENTSRTNAVYLVKSVSGPEFVCKQFYFKERTQLLRLNRDGEDWAINGNLQELQSAIVEYSLAKVCATLGVGIPVGSPDHHF